ncbi:MAG TPA: GtrA family protein [Anaerolineaceae bacterium]|nr:GtrA family protein [Anaerolineaceae bacterium]
MITTMQRERSRFFKFAMVGVLGAIVDFGVFNLLVNGFHLQAVPSSVVSFTCAIISNFLWNRFWTYPDSRSKRIHHQVVQFIMVSVIGLVIRTPLFAFLEPNLIGFFTRLNLPVPVSARFLGHNVSLAIAVIVVMFWNFFANRYWTYSDIQ